MKSPLAASHVSGIDNEMEQSTEDNEVDKESDDA